MSPFCTLLRHATFVICRCLLALSCLTSLTAAVPNILNFQGRIVVGSIEFNGTGQFKFALVNANGTTTYWSNDGSSTAGSAPTASLPLLVTKGLYAVQLGDTNMAAIPASVFANTDVRLRIWFNDNTNGFQQLAPDQRIASAAYAITAGSIALNSVYASPARWVVGWGANKDGQTTVPATLTNIAQVAAGSDHGLARKTDGTLIAWGRNVEGQCTLPLAATGIPNIAAGTYHSLAVKGDGTVLAWGANDFNQSTVPSTVTNVVQVAGGDHHSLARKGDGSVVAWGDNTFNQLTIPGTAVGLISIACGNDHSLGLKSNGTVIAWGRNDANQCDVPPTLSNVIAIAAGANHSLALKNDGTVVAWGWNTGGQSTVPDGLTNVVSIAAGYAHSVAAKSDGTVVVWGDNLYAQRTIPANTTQIVSVAAGGNFSLALRSSTVPANLARLDTDNVFLGRIGIGRTPTTNALEVEGQASKTTAGNWAANSDRRIKTDIQPVHNALELIDQLNPVTFRYTPEYRQEHHLIEDVPYYNVIAQEFRQVFPDAVKPSGEHLPDGSDILQVDTYPATITAIAAVKELSTKLKDKDREIAELNARLSALEQLLKAK